MPFSEVSICNMALARLGQSVQFDAGDGTVAGIDPDDANHRVAAEMCQLWYEVVRDAVGRDFAYGTTSKIATLVLVSDGTGEEWDGIWENAWEYPADALFIRGFVTQISGGVTWPNVSTETLWLPLLNAKWAIGMHDGDTVIFANNVDATAPQVEYTGQQTEAASNFVDVGLALSWRLAAELSLPLLGAEAGANYRAFCERNYQMQIDIARRSSANEAEPYDTGDGRWMTTRNG